MIIHHTHVAALLAVGTALAGAAGCGGSGDSNKAGASVHKTVTLKLAIPDVDDADGRFFAKAAERRSGGRLKVTLDDRYDSTDTSREARLPGALSNGSADLAYMPARDWARTGLPEFQALAAPFAVTTQPATQAVVRSAFAHDALSRLRDRHVIGLGLVPGEPRQLLSRRPLVERADFRSASLRVVLNPAVGQAVAGLGGTPVGVRDAARVGALLRAGRLTGTESSPQYMLSNGYVAAAPYVTSYAVSSKFQVIGASEAAWGRLDDAQRSALRAAAADTVVRARALPDHETQEMTAVCRQHAVVTRPSAAQVAAIAEAATVDSSAYAAAAKALAAVPGTGPQPSAVTIPSACAVAHDGTGAVAALRRVKAQRADGLPKSQSATIPDGTYVTTTTVHDLQQGGQYGGDWEKDITWTWRLKNGRMRETQKPDYPDQGPCGGTYRIKGDAVLFHWTYGCTEGGDEVVRWSFYNGQLAFKVVDVSDTAGRVIYSAHPWRKTD